MADKITIGICKKTRDSISIEVRSNGVFLTRREEKKPIPHDETMIFRGEFIKNEKLFDMGVHSIN